MLPLFEEHYHLYAPSDDPITMATHPPLIQFEHESYLLLGTICRNWQKTIAQDY